MNTPISTIKSCYHLSKSSLLAQMPQHASIGYISFKIWCMMHMWSLYTKGFTLKNDDANIYYVGDGHCSFLGIFVCNKNNYHP
jgi:hypothetical protein